MLWHLPAMHVWPFLLLQLPSKRQIMAKILKEREEAASLKQDPVFVDPDAEARARLKALQGGGDGGGAAAAAGGEGGAKAPYKTAQDELRELEEKEAAEAAARQAAATTAAAQQQRQQLGAAPAAPQAGDGEEAEDGGEGGEGGEFVDPTAGMSGRQKKLFQLQQRMKAARKANEHAVVIEKRKQAAKKADAAAGDGAGGDRQGSKRKWFEEKQKRKVCMCVCCSTSMLGWGGWWRIAAGLRDVPNKPCRIHGSCGSCGRVQHLVSWCLVARLACSTPTLLRRLSPPTHLPTCAAAGRGVG